MKMEMSEFPVAPPTTSSVPEFLPSYYVTYFSGVMCIFITAITLPSLEGYVLQFTTSQLIYGVAYSAFPAGILVGAIVAGFWTNRKGPRQVLLVSWAGTVLVSVWYACATTIPELFITRFLMGASTTLTPARSYLAQVSSPQTKTSVLARYSSMLALGYAVGPAVAVGLSFATFQINNIHVVPARVAGIICAITSLVLFLWLLFGFRNPPEFSGGAESMKGVLTETSLDTAASPVSAPSLTFETKLLAIVVLSAYGIIQGVGTGLLSVVTPQMTHVLHFTSTIGSGVLCGIGVLMCTGIIASAKLAKRYKISDYRMIMVGSIVCTLSTLLMIQYPAQDVTSFFTLYLIGWAFHAVGNTVAWSMLTPLFSKVLGRVQQGVWMGAFGSAAHACRTATGLIIGALLNDDAAYASFVIAAGMYTIVIIVLFLLRDRLQRCLDGERQRATAMLHAPLLTGDDGVQTESAMEWDTGKTDWSDWDAVYTVPVHE